MEKLTKKQNFGQALKFLLFSISAGIIQFGTFTLLNELVKWNYWPSYLIGLVLSVLYNFTINRQFTFKSANNVPIAMLKVAAYYAVFTPLSTLWGNALTAIGWNEYLVLFLTMVVNFVTEFLFCRFVVYRNAINTNERAVREAEREESLAGAAVAEREESLAGAAVAEREESLAGAAVAEREDLLAEAAAAEDSKKS